MDIYNIELHDQKFELHGYEDRDTYSDGSVSEPYFYVIKAYGFFQCGDDIMKAEYNNEAVRLLNDKYEQEIIDQIKEG